MLLRSQISTSKWKGEFCAIFKSCEEPHLVVDGVTRGDTRPPSLLGPQETLQDAWLYLRSSGGCLEAENQKHDLIHILEGTFQLLPGPWVRENSARGDLAMHSSPPEGVDGETEAEERQSLEGGGSGSITEGEWSGQFPSLPFPSCEACAWEHMNTHGPRVSRLLGRRRKSLPPRCFTVWNLFGE